MVAYCCVKGCSHNSSNKKKDPNDITSFHAFPTNIELKQKWLRAIGRPNWVPPSYARVCSSHFTYDQINHDGRRVRIKEDAVPVKELPVNSNFEASHVEVCRFCLATDLKMYSLQTGVHRVYLESIMECNENYKIDGLPQFICFECAAHLRKCYNLLEKSMVAQATLLDIFAHNGKISKNLINSKNREELNITSPLSVRVNKSILHIKYDDISEFVDVEKKENVYSIGEEHFDNISKIEVMDFDIECNDVKPNNYEAIETPEDVVSNIKSDATSEYENETDMDSVYDHDTKKLEIDDNMENKKIESCKRRNKQVKTNNNDGRTPDEINMENYFTIVQLSLKEQIEEWNSTKINKKITGESFKCETCFKVFAHPTTYRLHTAGHDPSRGTSECAVCKLRFKNDVLARSHANRVHAKKFYCKTCPKTFSNVGIAKKHHKWHSGFTYKCASCAFSSAHASALGAHVRALHARLACARCGHAFISLRGLKLHMAAAHRGFQDEEDPKYDCEQCGLSFSSEGARRVHVLTSKEHKKNTGLCDTSQDQSLKNTCSKCGVEFSSPKELVEHRRAEHRRVKKKKTSWSLPDDRYPTQCEHCGTEVSCRKEHWSHVRRQHPAARAAYRPVVTAVCHTCGKGFQNPTKLRLHALRHGPPTVPCVQCARLFHDKHALARHVGVHGERSHRCACGRAFRDKRHLDRHQRVHTGETPYDCTICGKKFKYSTSLNLHVKTIHYKLPYPPRKRTKAISGNDGSMMQ